MKKKNNLNPIHISIGELVYLKNENRRKLDSFYTGPYKITAITEPNCELQHVDFNKQIIVHKSKIVKQ